MNEKQILIFEDEWPTIKGSFELANIYAFNNELKFVIKTKSQNVYFSDWRDTYAAVFVDITLAKNTKLDGFNIVKKILEENLIDKNKLVVLTGNNRIEEKLKSIGVNTIGLNIVYKPVDFDFIADLLSKIL